MGFFDLNIPYETFQSSKPTRIKLVIKSMELGYSGIAYNRTIKGIISDKERCSIVPFSLSNLLNIVPSLSSSVNFHRELLNIPRATPFYQYARLTVCVDNPSQCQSLNSGNMILKSYDLIAVRPLNQLCFDLACEKSEVDIISIDFSDKLPFRLKLNMVKAAMERGVYFEITYSGLIADVQVRRQMISNAKLLVDWTRGRNLIISSAAPSVNDLRGPCDVANLSSLLGLSKERAKAAVSKNCRNLIANALRKKKFYKETIRVEPIYGNSESKGTMSLDWLKWDSISSGEGDLHLEDIAKSFSASTKASNFVKAVDFDLVIDSIKPGGGTDKLRGHDLLPEAHDHVLCKVSSSDQTLGHGIVKEFSLPSDTEITLTSPKEVRALTNTVEKETNSSTVLDAVLPSTETQEHGLQLQNLFPSELNALLAHEDVVHQTSAMEKGSTDACVSDAEINILSEKAYFLESDIEKSMNSYAVLGGKNAMMEKNIEGMGAEDQEDTSETEHASVRKQLRESQDVSTTGVDRIPRVLTLDEQNNYYLPSFKYQENLEEVIMEAQEHGDVNLDCPQEVVIEKQGLGNADSEIGLVEDSGFKAEDKFEGVEVVPSEEAVMEEQDHGDASLDHPEDVAMIEQGLGDADSESDLAQDTDFKAKDNDFKATDNSGGAIDMLSEEVAVDEQKSEQDNTESIRRAVVPPASGKAKLKQRKRIVFPFNRLWNSIAFKRRPKKSKRKRKV